MYYAPTSRSRPADTEIYTLSYVGVIRLRTTFPIDGLISFNANPIQPQLPKPHVLLADVLRQLLHINRGESQPIVVQGYPHVPTQSFATTPGSRQVLYRVS